MRPGIGVGRVQAAVEPQQTEQGRADATGVGPPEIVDEVTLSNEVRIRQNVTQASERVRPQDAEEDVPRAASVADQERMRELYRTDLQTRAGDDVPSEVGTIRMLPMFEVDIGPLGRAYAVDQGLDFDRPDPPSLPPIGPETVASPGFETDTGPPDPFAVDEVEAELPPVGPVEDETTVVRADASRPRVRAGGEPVDTEPIRVAGPEPPSEAPTRIELPQPNRAEQTAAAYQRAAALTGAPSGSGTELDAFA